MQNIYKRENIQKILIDRKQLQLHRLELCKQPAPRINWSCNPMIRHFDQPCNETHAITILDNLTRLGIDVGAYFYIRSRPLLKNLIENTQKLMNLLETLEQDLVDLTQKNSAWLHLY